MHSRPADTTNKGATPITPTSDRVSAGPVTAPTVPATAMIGNRRRACSLLQMSDMKLQNTDTTNRLNTLTHTKNSMPSALGVSNPCPVNSGTKPIRQAMKNTYTTGTTTAAANA
jgi:hypothetical protein